VADPDTADLAIFGLVVAIRFVVPLLIPRFPVPAIIVALVVDAADQTIFQRFTDLDLEGYQSYDKALDIYYLTIAYVSTLRNWALGPAADVARFLWYYRLVGVVLFEFTEARWLLLVFPNTFEYYFIAIEAYKTRRNPFRLTRTTILAIAAAIWVFVKLPQEWWIHIAQNDFTDFMRETVFGVTVDDSWATAIANRPLVSIGLVAAMVVLGAVVVQLTRRLPAAEWPFTFDADRQGDHLGWERPERRAVPLASFGRPFVEKVVLVSLVTMIFANILPGVDASGWQIVLGVAFVIGVNTVLSEYLARREVSWRSAGTQFLAMAAANLGALLLAVWLLSRDDGESLRLGNTMFFVALLTLIVVLFDRFRDLGRRRHAAPAAVPPTPVA
jgi:hypothetical protein